MTHTLVICPRCKKRLPSKGLGKHAITQHVRRGGRGASHDTHPCETTGCRLGAIDMDKKGILRCGNCIMEVYDG